MASTINPEPVWEPDRDNWSTTVRSTFHTEHPEKFSASEQARLAPVTNGIHGWETVPANGLTPDCNPVNLIPGGEWGCACGRRA
jgi:hypothetical protein